MSTSGYFYRFSGLPEMSMGNLLRTFSFLENCLKRQIPCVLLQVVESLGSSPGRGGFCMGVDLSGEMAGSIGGGIMEHKLVETARAFLREQREEALILPQVHSRQAGRHRSGMICSGEQTVLLFPLQLSDLPAVQAITEAELRYRPLVFCIRPEGFSFGGEPGPPVFRPASEESGWEYHSTAGEKPVLHIVGGGHCALALSGLMKSLDFRLHLYETRPEINTLRQNVFADEIFLLPGYSEMGDRLRNCPDDMVVVMTFGYRTDDEVIRSICGMSFRWLGLLGSKSKIARMMDDYRREGFPEEWLSRISAPVGLPIRSQTPEEIAVSIAAEIIAFRNGALQKSDQAFQFQSP